MGTSTARSPACGLGAIGAARGPAYTLGDMGSQQAVGPLLRSLGDESRPVRAAAGRSLGRLQAVEAVAPLVAALVEGRVPRAVAGHALLCVGPSSLPRLRGLALDSDAETRTVVTELIGLPATPPTHLSSASGSATRRPRCGRRQPARSAAWEPPTRPGSSGPRSTTHSLCPCDGGDRPRNDRRPRLPAPA
jgi:hypothetical protein